MPARLLMIALDGADSNLLERWSENGRLANLARLRRRGRVQHLTPPPGMSDDSLWASFQYGVGEADHGRCFYFSLMPSGKIERTLNAETDRDTFWHKLSARGLRLAIFDVPKCPPPRQINGIHLADWLVHGKYTTECLSYPPQLAEDVCARFGPPPPSRCDYHQKRLSDTSVRGFLHSLRATIVQKRQASLHYLAAEPWDLFIVGFKEGHCIGHGLWNFVDANHPEFDAARTARLGNPAELIFQDLDAAIGELAAAAGQDAEIVVFSTSAIEPNGSMEHLMPQIVVRMNAILSGCRASRLDIIYEWLRAELPMRAAWKLEAFYKWFRRHRPAASGPIVNMPATDSCGALRLAPGAAADAQKLAALQRQIWEMLEELVDIETGLPAVAWITYPSADPGERAAHLPDMLVHYSNGVVPGAVRSARLGRIGGRVRRRRPGNHVAGGLAIAAGREAACHAADLTKLDDFAAFIDKILGVAPACVAVLSGAIDPGPEHAAAAECTADDFVA